MQPSRGAHYPSRPVLEQLYICRSAWAGSMHHSEGASRQMSSSSFISCRECATQPGGTLPESSCMGTIVYMSQYPGREHAPLERCVPPDVVISSCMGTFFYTCRECGTQPWYTLPESSCIGTITYVAVPGQGARTTRKVRPARRLEPILEYINFYTPTPTKTRARTTRRCAGRSHQQIQRKKLFSSSL